LLVPAGGYEYKKRVERRCSGACVLFFSFAFYNFFDGLVLFVRNGRAGEQVVRWFVGSAVGNRAVSRSDGWEGVVEVSSVLSVGADVSFVAGASECRARRETARQTGKESSVEWVGETNRN
jgi:hypothetical protein